MKATLVLLPLLGITYMLFFVNTGEDELSQIVFIYFNSFLQSFQVGRMAGWGWIAALDCSGTHALTEHFSGAGARGVHFIHTELLVCAHNQGQVGPPPTGSGSPLPGLLQAPAPAPRTYGALWLTGNPGKPAP